MKTFHGRRVQDFRQGAAGIDQNRGFDFKPRPAILIPDQN